MFHGHESPIVKAVDEFIFSGYFEIMIECIYIGWYRKVKVVLEYLYKLGVKKELCTMSGGWLVGRADIEFYQYLQGSKQ